MSIDSCLIRVTSLELKSLQDQPESLPIFIQDLDKRSAFYTAKLADPVDRVLSVEEFTLSLLTDLYPLETPLAPLNRALRLGSHLLDGAHYGAGVVLFHTAEEVRVISEQLSQIPERDLRALFQEHAEDFRLAAAGYLDTDAAILEYQRAHFRQLVAFYQKAADQSNAMLLIVM